MADDVGEALDFLIGELEVADARLDDAFQVPVHLRQVALGTQKVVGGAPRRPDRVDGKGDHGGDGGRGGDGERDVGGAGACGDGPLRAVLRCLDRAHGVADLAHEGVAVVIVDDGERGGEVAPLCRDQRGGELAQLGIDELLQASAGCGLLRIPRHCRAQARQGARRRIGAGAVWFEIVAVAREQEAALSGFGVLHHDEKLVGRCAHLERVRRCPVQLVGGDVEPDRAAGDGEQQDEADGERRLQPAG